MIVPLALVIGCLLIHLQVSLLAEDQLFASEMPSWLAGIANVSIWWSLPLWLVLLILPRFTKSTWRHPWLGVFVLWLWQMALSWQLGPSLWLDGIAIIPALMLWRLWVPCWPSFRMRRQQLVTWRLFVLPLALVGVCIDLIELSLLQSFLATHAVWLAPAIGVSLLPILLVRLWGCRVIPADHPLQRWWTEELGHRRALRFWPNRRMPIANAVALGVLPGECVILSSANPCCSVWLNQSNAP